MSGVTLDPAVSSAISDLRMKKNRYVIMRIGESGKQIEVVEVGERSYSYQEFVKKIAVDTPCYAAFDFEYSDGGVSRDKPILIQWIPDTAKPREKMMYSSSRDALNAASQGYLPVQANEVSELETDEVIRRIKSHRTV